MENYGQYSQSDMYEMLINQEKLETQQSLVKNLEEQIDLMEEILNPVEYIEDDGTYDESEDNKIGDTP